MGQHKKLLRTDLRLHEAVEVCTQQQIDGLETELAAVNAHIREIETRGRQEPSLETLNVQAISLARSIDELRCSLRGHHRTRHPN
jgi:hypothetical protein